MQEEGMAEEEYKFGELRIRRRYKRKMIGAKKGDFPSEIEGREPYALVLIMELP
jgi:hypothetical protein